jgi:hypothetical protein
MLRKKKQYLMVMLHPKKLGKRSLQLESLKIMAIQPSLTMEEMLEKVKMFMHQIGLE